jgi:hypothetical protein
MQGFNFLKFREGCILVANYAATWEQRASTTAPLRSPNNNETFALRPGKLDTKFRLI